MSAKKRPVRSAQSTTLAGVAGNYAGLLADIKQRIRTAQVRTAMAGNASLLMLYWEIGGVLASQQKAEGWGAGVLPRLAADLHNEVPEVKGFSMRNLKLMTQFHREYPDLSAIGQPSVAQLAAPSNRAGKGPLPVAQLRDRPSDEVIQPQPVTELPAEPGDIPIGQRIVAQLPWAHNVILIQKVKDLPKAIGVSAYQLTRALPKKLQSILPSIDQLEQELSQGRSSKSKTPVKKTGANDHQPRIIFLDCTGLPHERSANPGGIRRWDQVRTKSVPSPASVARRATFRNDGARKTHQWLQKYRLTKNGRATLLRMQKGEQP